MGTSTPSALRSARRLFCVCVFSALVGSCGPIYQNHGYVPAQEDLDLIAVGIDTRASVEETLGSGGAGSVRQDDAIYFVRSRLKTVAMLEPQVIERTVVAISFDNNGVVENIETFGLEDGQIVPLARRVTDTTVQGRSFLRQLFGNIGRFTPGGGVDGV